MMIPPISIDAAPTEPRATMASSDRTSPVADVESLQDSLFSGPGSMFEQLQLPALLGDMGYPPSDGLFDDSNGQWGFHSPAGSTRTHLRTAVRLLQRQYQLDRWSFTTTAVSNIAKSLTDTVRTVTQDR